MGEDVGLKRAQKDALRRTMRRLRKELGAAERERFDRGILDQMRTLEEYCAARRVMVYLSLPEEADTWGIARELLSRGAEVAAPVTGAGPGEMEAHRVESLERVRRGRFGMPEPFPGSVPMPPEAFDLVVVPGLAFSKDGKRIGYGGGYYDRYLPRLSAEAATVGLAYGFQVVPAIPGEPHDIPLRAIVTPEGVLRV